MAMRDQEYHEGIELLLVDPHLQVNDDDELLTSMTPQDYEGIESLDVNPYSLANRDDEELVNRTTSTRRRIEVDLNYYLPLYLAALNGDWETARRFIKSDPKSLTDTISIRSMTALHAAASVGRFHFVEKLVELMPSEALEMQDYWGRTALHYVAVSGSTKVAKAMVTKNPLLTQITDNSHWTPLLYAAACPNKELAHYLSLETKYENPSRSPFTGPMAGMLICNLASAGFHDIALCLLRSFPKLATATANDRAGTEYSVLTVLAEKPSAFRSGSRPRFWKRCIYPLIPVELNYEPPHVPRGNVEDPRESSSDLTQRFRFYLARVRQSFSGLLWRAIELVPCFKQVRDEKLGHIQAVELVKHVCRQLAQMNNSHIEEFFQDSAILTTAASFGIVEIIEGCLQTFPDMIWFRSNLRTILHVAVENRRHKIFNLMREKTARNMIMASWAVESRNKLLHLAAKLPPSPLLKSVSGSALQVQRELQWFKEVEKFVPPLYREQRNANYHTAWEVFTEEHKQLVESGEKWMKETSNSCMLVTTLIATVVFAAAFTVPGGNNNNDGIPIFLNHNSFIVFAISDAVALFSSAASLLMFLSILTSRFAEEDFLGSLPKNLIIGIGSLFVAIATMMIAFGAALSIVLSGRFKRASIPITLVACFPVILFALLQLPLFIQMVQSTYGSGIFHRKKNRRL